MDQQEVQTKQISPIHSFKQSLMQAQPEFVKALGPGIDAEKFLRVAMTTIQNNPDLLSKNRQSLFSSIHSCAQDGLMPDGKEAALVPFKNEVKYMPMVAGYCKRARNSGEIGTIDAQVVYENDEFEEWIDESGQHFKHKKKHGDRGEREGVYAYALTRDKFLYFEFLDSKRVEASKKLSRSPNIWNGPFGDEMWRKTALRNLCKYRLPSSSDLNNMFNADEDLNFEVEDNNKAVNDSEESPQKSSRLASVVEQQQESNNEGIPI